MRRRKRADLDPGARSSSSAAISTATDPTRIEGAVVADRAASRPPIPTGWDADADVRMSRDRSDSSDPEVLAHASRVGGRARIQHSSRRRRRSRFSPPWNRSPAPLGLGARQHHAWQISNPSTRTDPDCGMAAGARPDGHDSRCRDSRSGRAHRRCANPQRSGVEVGEIFGAARLRRFDQGLRSRPTRGNRVCAAT